MTEKRFELTVSRKNNGVSIIDNSNNNSTLFFVSYIVLDDTLLVRNHLKPVVDKLNELHEENQQYKALLQDMGMILSDDEIKNIRNEIADKIIKPLHKSNGFDVDVDTTDGFTIIVNKNELNEWINEQELQE